MKHGQLGVPAPFEELIQRHEREIMRYLLRLTGDREDAADLFQETWLRAYRAYPRVDASGDLRPWLYAIATNLSRNYVRDGARRARVITSNRSKPAGCVDVEKTAPAQEGNDGYAAIHVRDLIARLPAKQRRALLMRYLGGLEYAEIAAALECSEESARANVSQAMKKLNTAW